MYLVATGVQCTMLRRNTTNYISHKSAVDADRLSQLPEPSGSITIDGFVYWPNPSKHDKGNNAFYHCQMLPPGVVDSMDRPTIKVCGNQVKVTVFLDSMCRGTHEYMMEIGVCDASKPANSCETQGPETSDWIMDAKTIMVSRCAVPDVTDDLQVFCDQGFTIERHAAQSGHGDVCRGGGTWRCPVGCQITNGQAAPYCIWKGTNEECHV